MTNKSPQSALEQALHTTLQRIEQCEIESAKLLKEAEKLAEVAQGIRKSLAVMGHSPHASRSANRAKHGEWQARIKEELSNSDKLTLPELIDRLKNKYSAPDNTTRASVSIALKKGIFVKNEDGTLSLANHDTSDASVSI